jgi:hypothetical protein
MTYSPVIYSYDPYQLDRDHTLELKLLRVLDGVSGKKQSSRDTKIISHKLCREGMQHTGAIE